MSTLIKVILFIGYFIIGLFMTAIFDAIFDSFEDDDCMFAFAVVVLFWPLVLAALLVLAIVLQIYPSMKKIAKKLTKQIKEKIEEMNERGKENVFREEGIEIADEERLEEGRAYDRKQNDADL